MSVINQPNLQHERQECGDCILWLSCSRHGESMDAKTRTKNAFTQVERLGKFPTLEQIARSIPVRHETTNPDSAGFLNY